MPTPGPRTGAEPGATPPQPRLLSVREPETVATLQRLISQTTSAAAYPLASSIESNIPHYDLGAWPDPDAAAVARLQDEWYRVLHSGPGVLVLRGFVASASVLAATNAAFAGIIADEASAGGGSGGGDHFAPAGANARVWNAHQKLAARAPAAFVAYAANPWRARVAEAWLGPGARVTAQLNVVRPGGRAQAPHRDYHLGFQGSAACARFPSGLHAASAFLTLQGGVAHSDMPLASGPTRVLPYSQQLAEGYLAWRLEGVRALFDAHWTAAPMAAGDAVFFSPALLHAAGANTTADVHRSANLLQLSSALAKPMEAVDSVAVVRACWDEIKALAAAGEKGEVDDSNNNKERVAACIGAVAEAYPFPTNLDRRQPGPGGMAPTSEVDILWEGLEKGWSTETVVEAMMRLRADSAP
ncbi:hypothetical protein F4780DRAFT_790985 [Xylariomycetidae sp. FL0641]|nr:hypothetical protein F4780DRAFT_790985 [Xylariomycetidae sp. FL0641]